MRLALCFLLSLLPVNFIYPRINAAEISSIVITELSIGNTTSASYEYVEIINVGETTLDLAGWKVQYLSATGTNWLQKTILDFKISPNSKALIAAELTGLDADAVLTTGLAGTGGHIRIVDTEGNEIDKLGWGSAEQPETQATEVANSSQVYKRLVNEDGKPIDTNNNFNDFILSQNPTPEKSYQDLTCQTPKPVGTTEPEPEVVVEPESEIEENKYYPPLKLSELFIDPKSPLTDKDDEFVEIYNPNNFALDIAGYVIESGVDFKYSYIFPSYRLKAGEYLAIFSIDSNLTLPNSGGMARLLDPAQKEVDLTLAYSKAKSGNSWAKDGDNLWYWTIPTPHQANIFTSETGQEKPEEQTVLQVLSKRTPNTSGGEVLNKKQEAGTLTERKSYQEPPAEPRRLDNKILVGLGIVGLLYASYEYREDIANLYFKLKRYLFIRRADRQKP